MSAALLRSVTLSLLLVAVFGFYLLGLHHVITLTNGILVWISVIALVSWFAFWLWLGWWFEQWGSATGLCLAWCRFCVFSVWFRHGIVGRGA